LLHGDVKMKILIILLSLSIAASSIPAQASNPQSTPTTKKSWVPAVLMGGGAIVALSTFYWKANAKGEYEKTKYFIDCKYAQYRTDWHDIKIENIPTDKKADFKNDTKLVESRRPSSVYTILHCAGIGLVGLGGFCLGRQKK